MIYCVLVEWWNGSIVEGCYILISSMSHGIIIDQGVNVN